MNLASCERAERRRQLRAFLREHWVAVAFNVLVGGLLFVSGYGLRAQTERALIEEADRRTAKADSLVAGCFAASNEVAGAAEQAIGEARRAERAVEESETYRAFMRGRSIVVQNPLTENR